MPLFKLVTNVAKSQVSPNFHKATAELVAKLLGKPEQNVVVVVIPGADMTRGASDAPCGFIEFLSIGKLGPEENIKHSAAVFEHVEKHVGIPKDRLLIRYIDAKATELGYNGTTMAEFLKSSGAAGPPTSC